MIFSTMGWRCPAGVPSARGKMPGWERRGAWLLMRQACDDGAVAAPVPLHLLASGGGR